MSVFVWVNGIAMAVGVAFLVVVAVVLRKRRND